MIHLTPLKEEIVKGEEKPFRTNLLMPAQFQAGPTGCGTGSSSTQLGQTEPYPR
jgi:hypothetical protein